MPAISRATPTAADPDRLTALDRVGGRSGGPGATLRDEHPEQRIGSDPGPTHQGEQGEGDPDPEHRHPQVHRDPGGNPGDYAGLAVPDELGNAVRGEQRVDRRRLRAGAESQQSRRDRTGGDAGTPLRAGRGGRGRRVGRRSCRHGSKHSIVGPVYGQRWSTVGVGHLTRFTRARRRSIGVHPGCRNQGHPRWCRDPRFDRLVAWLRQVSTPTAPRAPVGTARTAATGGPGARGGPRQTARSPAWPAASVGTSASIRCSSGSLSPYWPCSAAPACCCTPSAGCCWRPTATRCRRARRCSGKGRSSTSPVLAVGLGIVAVISLFSVFSWGLPFIPAPVVIAVVILVLVMRRRGRQWTPSERQGFMDKVDRSVQDLSERASRIGSTWGFGAGPAGPIAVRQPGLLGARRRWPLAPDDAGHHNRRPADAVGRPAG